MFGLNIWDLIGILALLSLIISVINGINAIWGALTLGIIICVVVGTINYFSGNPFLNWSLFQKIVAISVLAVALFEIIDRLDNLPKNPHSMN